MTLLDVAGLGVKLGGKAVLRDAAFSAGPGELIGLVGPNGAGKSTLLRAVLQLLPFEGVIRIGGADTGQMTSAERARRVAYLAQDRDIAWDIPVEMVVALGRHPYRERFAGFGDGDRVAIDGAMAQMDVTHLRHRPATELSGGEKARVLMARTLAQDTPLILADEPTAGLDPSHQIGLMRALAGLAASGKTVVASLHDLGLAMRWCSRLLLLDQGRLVADGPPPAVLTPERLRDVYGVEAFFGEANGLPVVLPIDLVVHPKS